MLLKAKRSILVSVSLSKAISSRLDLLRLQRQCNPNKNGFTMNSTSRGLPRCGLRNTYGERRMSDNFGKIMVLGDYEGNLKAIVDKLNSLRWSFESGGGREWAVEQSSAHEWGAHKGRDHKKGRGHKKGRDHKKREIIVLNGDLPDPSLRPVGKIIVLKDGRRRFADDADASFIEQWEADKDDGAFDWDECTLRELRLLFHRTSAQGAMIRGGARLTARSSRAAYRSIGWLRRMACVCVDGRSYFCRPLDPQGHGVLRSISLSSARGQRTTVFWGDQMAPPSGLRHTNLNGA